MALPQGISRANFLHHLEPTDGVLHSITLKGGYQEMISISERNAIPTFENSHAPYSGFTLSDDSLSTGKRRAGMLVFVLEENKSYRLIPVGFFGNGGDLGENEWLALPEWERALRMDPSGTYCSEGASPVNGFTSVQNTATDIGIEADPNSCWVEVNLGSNNIYGHFNFISNGNESYSVGQDSDYMGGAEANQNPTIYVTKGETYRFIRGNENHPLEILKDDNVITAGIQSGSFPITYENHLDWKIPFDAQGIFTYRCTVHHNMIGQIIVIGSDGVITGSQG